MEDSTNAPSSTRWQKGQSGNPGGRPKTPEYLKDRIRSLSDKAVDALEQALASDDDRVKIQAAQILLDRGYGKSAQQADVTVTTKNDMAQAHLDALLAMSMRARDEPLHPDIVAGFERRTIEGRQGNAALEPRRCSDR